MGQLMVSAISVQREPSMPPSPLAPPSPLLPCARSSPATARSCPPPPPATPRSSAPGASAPQPPSSAIATTATSARTLLAPPPARAERREQPDGELGVALRDLVDGEFGVGPVPAGDAHAHGADRRRRQPRRRHLEHALVDAM